MTSNVLTPTIGFDLQQFVVLISYLISVFIIGDFTEKWQLVQSRLDDLDEVVSLSNDI